MGFEQYMNPPILDDIMEQIEEAVGKKKKYKDIIAGFNLKTNVLSVDVYWGKANYAVYSYDKQYFVINKANSVEKDHDIENIVDKEDKRISKILFDNILWVEQYYKEKVTE